MEEVAWKNTKIFGINQDIARCAARKDLVGAWSLFESAVNEKIANIHTFAAAVNAAVRCGKMDRAQEAVRLMEAAKLKKDVIICTTLMKGFCGCCQISSAKAIFDDMVLKAKGNNVRIKPNIRTVNTLLRGCVQNGEVKLAEGVIAQSTKELKIQLDISSWEYLVTLLSQSLQIDKILPILGRLKNEREEMQSGMIPMHLQLARSAALLGDWKLCQKELAFCSMELQSASASKAEEDDDEKEKNKEQDEEKGVRGSIAMAKETKGGKRAWKSIGGNTDVSQDKNRNQSLDLFRKHQREEWKQDLQCVRLFLETRQIQSVDFFDYLLPFFQRCLLFNCDSSAITNNANVATTVSVSKELMVAVANKFGMGSLLKRRCGKGPEDLQQLIKKQRKESKQSAVAAGTTITTAVEESSSSSSSSNSNNNNSSNNSTAHAIQAWQDFKQRFLNYLTPELYLDFQQVFSAQPMAPLKLEICSGAGEWAVEQAQHDAQSNWLTLELRHDRVYQTFCKMVFAGVSNLAVMAGDAKRVIPRFVQPDTFAALFVNHPEPPQQIGGMDSSAEHLLDAAFFTEMHRILAPNGTLTIVTDNLWYGKLLTRCVHNLSHQMQDDQEMDNPQPPPPQFQSIEPIASAEWVPKYTEGETILWVGIPGVEAGHVISASSYFDRLWKRGASKERYFLVLRKKGSDEDATDNNILTQKNQIKKKKKKDKKRSKQHDEQEEEKPTGGAKRRKY